MGRVIQFALAALMTLVVAAPVAAQETKPAIVVSIASHEKLMTAADQIIQMSGVPAPKKPEEMFDEIVKEITGGKALAGLDKSKPWGAVLPSGSSMADFLVFAPINDIKALLDAMPENVKKTDEGDGVTKLSRTDGPDTTCLKGANGWVYAAQTAQQLKVVPADPGALLGDLPARYLMAVKIKGANISPEQRKELWANLEHGLPPDALEKLKSGVDQFDEVIIGWKVDAAAKQIIAEVTVTAIAGSQLAGMAPRMADRPTRFAGLRGPDAAIFFATSIAGELTPAELDEVKKQHDTALKAVLEQVDDDRTVPAESKPVVKEALSTLLAVWFDTAKSGVRDGGLAVITQPKLGIVAGGNVSDGDAVVTALKRLATLVEGDPSVSELKWDAEEHGGYKLHVMKIKVPPPGALVVGEIVEIVAAVNKKSVLLAAGPDASATVKKVIDASAAGAEKVPAVAFTLRLKPLVEAAAKMGPPNPMLQPLVQQMAALKPGADEVTFMSVPLDHGVMFRLTINEGAIKAIGLGIAIREAAMRPRPFPGGPGGPGGDGGFAPPPGKAPPDGGFDN